MLEYTKENRNLIGIIIGLSYTLYFNYNPDILYPVTSTIGYSLPFLIVSFLIGFTISLVRKDKNYGIYFALISLIFLNIN